MSQTDQGTPLASRDDPMNEPSPEQPFREQLLAYLLLRASNAVSDGFVGTLKERGIPVREWRVLGSLCDVSSLTIGDLADAILCEQSSTTRLVDRLVAAGLVGKRAASGDRRKVHVYLTEKGREEAAHLVAHALDLERDVAETHGLDNTEALKTVLRSLIERIS